MGWMARRLVIGVGASAAVAALTLTQAAAAGAVGTGAARAAATVNCSAPYVPPPQPQTGNLVPGSKGPAVLALQQRLNCLGYWVGPINGTFGQDTLFAVWAFKEVQAGKLWPAAPDMVGPGMQQQLAKPAAPPVLHPNGGSTRIEVNKTLQVMVLYKNNKISLISHVSTAKYCLPLQGCKWATPDGKYHAEAFMPGWIKVPLGYMFNPVFFIGYVYAIHGDINPSSLTDLSGVALVPASHGCVRMPYDLAKVFHNYLKIASGTAGTTIYIDGPAHQ